MKKNKSTANITRFEAKGEREGNLADVGCGLNLTINGELVLSWDIWDSSLLDHSVERGRHESGNSSLWHLPREWRVENRHVGFNGDAGMWMT